MYAVPQNRSSEKAQNEEFNRLVDDLKKPLPEPKKVLIAGKDIPHFRDCLDKSGKFSEKKFNRLALRLNPNRLPSR